MGRRLSLFLILLTFGALTLGLSGQQTGTVVTTASESIQYARQSELVSVIITAKESSLYSAQAVAQVGGIIWNNLYDTATRVKMGVAPTNRTTTLIPMGTATALRYVLTNPPKGSWLGVQARGSTRPLPGLGFCQQGSSYASSTPIFTRVRQVWLSEPGPGRLLFKLRRTAGGELPRL